METEIVEIVETAAPAVAISLPPINVYTAVGFAAGAAAALGVVGVVKWRKKKAALAAIETENQTAE